MAARRPWVGNITIYTDRQRKKEKGDTLSGHNHILDHLVGYNTPKAARPLSKVERYRKEYAELHVSLDAMELERHRAKFRRKALTRYGRERDELRQQAWSASRRPTPGYDEEIRFNRGVEGAKITKPPDWLHEVQMTAGRAKRRPLSARLGLRRTKIIAPKNALEREIDAHKESKKKRPSSAPVKRKKNVEEQLRTLADLKATGALTDAEYAKAKAQYEKASAWSPTPETKRKPGSLAFRIFGAGKKAKAPAAPNREQLADRRKADIAKSLLLGGLGSM